MVGSDRYEGIAGRVDYRYRELLTPKFIVVVNNGLNAMVDNSKPEAISERQVGSPRVQKKSLWYGDGENVYPKAFVKVNGVLLSYDGAKTLRDKLTEILD